MIGENESFEAGDPFDDLGRRETELMVEASPRPAKGYVAVPVPWLAKVLPLVHSADQLAILLLLYRRCLMSRSRTVTLPNSELAAVGVTRFAKYRLLTWLQDAGAATVAPRNGRAVSVTLRWFP
jgi:hypothetical protein